VAFFERAEDHAWHQLDEHDWPLLIQTQKAGKFNRYVATVQSLDGVDLGELLLAGGYAVPYE